MMTFHFSALFILIFLHRYVQSFLRSYQKGVSPYRTFHRISELKKSPFYCIGKEVTPIPTPQSLLDNPDPDAYWKTYRAENIIPIDLDERYQARPQLITFDALDTLIMPSQSMGKFFRLALCNSIEDMKRFPRPAFFTNSYRSTFKRIREKYPCFGARDDIPLEEWWKIVIEETIRNTPQVMEEITEEELQEAMPKVFQTLYHNLLGTELGWVVKPDVEYTLTKLAEWRDMGSGPKLGVVSNFDNRLRNVLQELNLLKYFDFVLTSQEARSEKPSAGIFLRAQELAKVANPKLAFHVGSSIDEDVVGALNAGWIPMRFNEHFDEDFPDWNDVDETMESLDASTAKEWERMKFGRRDTNTGHEWAELWNLDNVLHLFGFPEDEDRVYASTAPIGVYED